MDTSESDSKERPMSSNPATTNAFDRAVAKIPTCALDEAGMSEQRARYARLAPSVTRAQREPEAVLIEFDQGSIAKRSTRRSPSSASAAPSFSSRSTSSEI